MQIVEGRLVDIHRREIYPVRMEIEEGTIAKIVEIEDCGGDYILPGFVDAHIHIESSMLPPSEFARLAVRHGTVATVSDPHEIANVLGVEGVKFMLENASKTPLRILFGASPCVPATPFETSGAVLGVEEIEELLSMDGVGYLSEVMNFPAVIAADEDMMGKIAAAKRAGVPIDGHCPALRGESLSRYIDAGIETDHESFGYEEAKEKIEKGMKILIREGSAAKNFEALHPLIAQYPEKLMFCSDDRHPDELMREHIDAMVRRSVKLGYDLFDVLTIASLNPVEHYRLDVGLLREGERADFIMVGDLEEFEVVKCFIGGVCVAEKGETLLPGLLSPSPNNFSCSKKEAGDFYMPECERMEVIEVVDHQLITKERISPPNEEILKIAVINRYENRKIEGLAHICGFGPLQGAIASSVAHDSHNIVVVGTDDDSMAQAANLIIDSTGGISAVGRGKKMLLPLPIAGLMSDMDGFETAALYQKMDRFVKEELGSTLSAPFMTLSFAALLVIPELKLSDRGLFDSNTFHFISPCRQERE